MPDIDMVDGATATDSVFSDIAVFLTASANATDFVFNDIDVLLSDAATASDALIFDNLMYLLSTAIASDDMTMQVVLTQSLVSDAYGRDYLIAEFPISIADSATASDVISTDVLATEELFDDALASISAEVLTVMSENLISVAIGSDTITFGFLVLLTDVATASDALTMGVYANAELSDAAAVTDEFTTLASMTIALSENATATDALSHQMIVSALLDSTAIVHVLLSVGNEVFDVWVMNTELGAVSTYSDFDFQGFARLGEKYFGLRDDGIHVLSGTKSAGRNIIGSVATGLSNLGTEYKKRVPAVYVGYTAEGALVMKIVTTDAGTKRENWYTLSPIAKPATTDNRFSPAKGLNSVYWQAKIVGQNFTLDSVKLWRALTSRRK